MKTSSKQEGYSTVELIDGNIVSVALIGFVSGDVVQESLRQTKALADELAAQQKPANLLIDIRRISGQDSRARTLAKDLRNYPFNKIAVFGGRQSIRTIGKYIAYSTGMGEKAHFFQTRPAALLWLKQSKASKNTVSAPIKTGLAAALFGITTLAVATLLGWWFKEPVLNALNVSFKPMNPVVAITFLLLCAAIPMALSRTYNIVQRYFLLFTLIWTGLFAGTTLLHALFSLDLYTDAWLFTSQLDVYGFSGRISPLASLLFMLSAILMGLFFTVNKRRKGLYITEAIIAILLGASVSSIIGYSFAYQPMYTLGTGLPLPLNTAFCFALLAIAFILLYAARVPATPARRFGTTYWQGILVFLAVIILTGFAWQQAKQSLEKDRSISINQSFNTTINTINSRFTAYIEVLRGFRAFFASSDSVTAVDFDRYFNSVNIDKNYPGINAVSFIRNVPYSQQAAFINNTRSLTSPVQPSPYPNYKIYPPTTSTAYPVLYAEPSDRASGFGFDLASTPGRLRTIETARDTGQPTATGKINLNASRGANQPERAGFFISMPIYTQSAGGDPTNIEARRAQSYGFVHAIFSNDTLFKDIFNNIPSEEVKYVVSYESTGEIAYQSSSPSSNLQLARSVILTIAGERWKIDMYATPLYGVTSTQSHTPQMVLFGGLVVAFMAGLLLFSLSRRRNQAIQLASDMTEDLRNERNNAVALQQKDEAILSSIGDAVFAINTEGIITLLNPAAAHISGYSARESVGQPYEKILRFESSITGKPNVRFIKRALNGEVSTMGEPTILIRKDGSRVQVADSAAPIRSADNTIQGVIVVFRDVSKEFELDKAKTEFVSLASHQLRTPLSAIGWYSEMLLNGDAGKLSKEQREYLNEIYEGNQRMVELVTSLLDVSRLDLGKLSNNPEAIDGSNLIDSLEKEMMTTIQAKNLHVEKHITKKLLPIEADPKLLRMIFQNVMSNAVKYTPERGHVTITLREASSQDTAKAGIRGHKPAVLLSVSDTGYGIPKAQQPKIFSKLFRADNVRALDVEGTGLGLYIVKQAVQKLGGQIWFDSIESAGTTFYVVIPHHTKKDSKVRNADNTAKEAT